MEKLINLGQVAYSLSGRDAGRYYLIVGFLQNGYVLVADGEKHKMDAPKKKNTKHLKIYQATMQDIAQKILDGKRVYNSELIEKLKKYNG